MDNLKLSLISAAGVFIVAIAPVVFWRRVTKLRFKWFWAGAGLWFVAVALKIACAFLTNAGALRFMQHHLPHAAFVVGGGLLLGIQSSMFEIGLTFFAVLRWRQLGQDADRAIGIGIGAGAFEALLLGVLGLLGPLAALFGLPGTEKYREAVDAAAAVTPLFWCLAPVERVIAILCHASSRALVLLGVKDRSPKMVFWGFVIFTGIDGIAGAAHLTGRIGKMSMWWIELALLPFALASIPILRWCCAKWGRSGQRA